MVQAHPGAQREDSRKAVLSFCLYSVSGLICLGGLGVFLILQRYCSLMGWRCVLSELDNRSVEFWWKGVLSFFLLSVSVL